MVVAERSQSCEIYTFTNDSWSALPDLKPSSYFKQLIAIDGMLIAGGETSFESLDLEPNLIHKLVHYAVLLDLFHSPCGK